MMERVRVFTACVAVVLIGAPAARADEEALRRRIEELEAQQRQVLEQLKEMKHELDAERQQRAVPAAAPAPVAAPVPVAPAAPAVAAPAAAPTAEQAAAPPSPAPAGGEGSRVTEV